MHASLMILSKVKAMLLSQNYISNNEAIDLTAAWKETLALYRQMFPGVDFPFLTDDTVNPLWQ